MPRKRAVVSDQIEKDFLDALQRIKAGNPKDTSLRRKISRGTPIKINISNVALEAGRARGLIAMENCRYPKVRQLVLMEAGAPGVEPGNLSDVIGNLRAQVAELRAKLADSMSHAAYHLDLRTQAERRLDEYKGRYERLKAKVEKGNLADQGKVVRLHAVRTSTKAKSPPTPTG